MKDGKVSEIIFDAPFILVEKTEHDGLEEQTIPVLLKEMIKCTSCGEEKPRDAFHRTRTNRTGLQSFCIECKVKRKEERDAEKEARREAWAAQENETK